MIRVELITVQLGNFFVVVSVFQVLLQDKILHFTTGRLRYLADRNYKPWLQADGVLQPGVYVTNNGFKMLQLFSVDHKDSKLLYGTTDVSANDNFPNLYTVNSG